MLKRYWFHRGRGVELRVFTACSAGEREEARAGEREEGGGKTWGRGRRKEAEEEGGDRPAHATPSKP
jgi:hypothetical protein